MIDTISTKPLVRWTIGPGHPIGLDCLRRAIKNFAKIYPEFDQIICYNGLTPDQVKYLTHPGVSFCNQNEFRDSLAIPPRGPGWKLYPPRLRPNAYELSMDNDIILFARSETIDKSIKTNIPVISEGLYRNFGIYDKFVRPGLQLNSGIYGLPPGFDFTKELEGLIRSGTRPDMVRKWSGHLDKQGLVSAVISRNDFLIIPLEEVFVSGEKLGSASSGFHFVKLNGGWTKFYDEFLKTYHG